MGGGRGWGQTTFSSQRDIINLTAINACSTAFLTKRQIVSYLAKTYDSFGDVVHIQYVVHTVYIQYIYAV